MQQVFNVLFQEIDNRGKGVVVGPDREVQGAPDEMAGAVGYKEL